jgi:hypothetical protein
MRPATRWRLLGSTILLCGGAAACAGRSVTDVDGVSNQAGAASEIVASARVKFPHMIDMHQKIVSRTCAPNAGVCHNTAEYPDLTTPGSMLQAVGAWCNLDMPDPTQGDDACERKGVDIVVPNALETELGWLDRDSVDHWTIGLRDPAPADVAAADVYFYDHVPDQPAFLPSQDWQVVLTVTKGETTAKLDVNGVADNPFIEQYIDEVLGSLIGGDPNKNGVYGADTHDDSDDDRVIAKGSLQRSYLWGRITGTVPGSRMPLANQPLADDEYVAVACFIETLDEKSTPDSPIDYDHCDFAKHPQSLAVK